MAKQINVRIVKNSKGEWEAHYEGKGYVGSSCDELLQSMQSIGEVQNYQATHGAREIPIPVPNRAGR